MPNGTDGVRRLGDGAELYSLHMVHELVIQLIYRQTNLNCGGAPAPGLLGPDIEAKRH